jgi:3',5'-cyclic-AMP phosphodiesterase
MAPSISRRGMLKRCAISVTAAVAGGWLRQIDAREVDVPASANSALPRRVLRFAHPTDIHVEPELHGAEGMAVAFRHMLALKDPPQMLLVGGDMPMDIAATPHRRADMLWSLYKKILRDNVPASILIHHAIGNHDIWGRDKQACQAMGNEPFYGKKWFLDEFGYPRTYCSFDAAGWHFVVLDSFDLDPAGSEYTSRIVGEQLDWLKADLKGTPARTPIVLVTHVPIISVAAFYEHETEVDPDIKILRTRMHTDFEALGALFLEHPNVKLCLSGHLHQLDRVEYNGLTHICDGAVCGDKWKGPRRQTPEGYGLIDLFDDGSFKHQYVAYGWKADRA